MPRRSADSPTLIDLPPPGPPSDRFERRAKRKGARLVAGVDEAGRGPLAGPVVVAAVVFEHGRYPDGLNDSKQLTELQREALYGEIHKRATVSVVVASRARIDRMNILRASLWGMSRAVGGLSIRPDYVLVDGNMLPPNLPCPAEAIVDGDALSFSIAAASIVAKVTRDRLMKCLGRAFPEYRFEEHKGYSTPGHFEALREHGPCLHHRRSFAPIRIALGVEPVQDDLFPVAAVVELAASTVAIEEASPGRAD